MNMRNGWIGIVALAALSSGCFGRDGLRCEDSARYSSSTSVAPLRIPGELTPPDQSGALRVPPGIDAPLPPQEPGHCLEIPPDFVGGQPAASSS
jgi:hypothetical protein